MSAATASSTVFVQQTFAWDLDGEIDQASATPTVQTMPTRVARPSGRPKLEVPQYSTSTSTRRNRCEHVGGVMSAVLGKYGISIDDLINAIEESRGQNA